jgi:phosphoglycerate-specific signal transduction histidine kinase
VSTTVVLEDVTLQFHHIIGFIHANQIGALAALLDLVVLIIGFAMTFSRIGKLEKASQQARMAAERLQDQILKMNAVQELGGAISTIEDMRRLPHLAPMPVLPDRYASLKQDLIAIRGRISDLTDRQRSTIQGAIQQISNVEEQVQHAMTNGGTPALNRINEVISKQVDQLAHVLSELKSQIDRPGR